MADPSNGDRGSFRKVDGKVVPWPGSRKQYDAAKEGRAANKKARAVRNQPELNLVWPPEKEVVAEQALPERLSADQFTQKPSAVASAMHEWLIGRESHRQANGSVEGFPTFDEHLDAKGIPQPEE
jgi:hypothetical protein